MTYWYGCAGLIPDHDGTAADVRYLKNEDATADRQLRDRLTIWRSGLRPDDTKRMLAGLNGASFARRLTAAARAAGIDGRITGHSEVAHVLPPQGLGSQPYALRLGAQADLAGHLGVLVLG